MVAFRRGNVLSVLPPRLPAVRTRETAHRASSNLRCAWTVRPDGALLITTGSGRSTPTSEAWTPSLLAALPRSLSRAVASRVSCSGVLAGFGAAILVFSLCFSIRAYSWGLGRNGLNMTILAVGACMVIAVAAQTQWRSPRILGPLLTLGQRSYEVYLTHMFVVFGLFQIFVVAGKPMRAVPALFIVVILVSGLSGRARRAILLRADESLAPQTLGRWSRYPRLGS